MWSYDKLLEFPVNIKRPNAKAAQVILSQYGGPDGELGASLRYLSQKFAMPNRRVAGLLNDIGTEELAHLEMIGAIVHQLTRNLSIEEIKKSGFDVYFVDHTTGIYPQAASGTPFSASILQSTGDVLADLHEDMAAEQKKTASPERCEQLEIMERTLRKVPEHGADDLYEAIQSFMIIWQIMCLEQTPNPFAFSVGNADRIFEPYRNGLDRDTTAALLKHSGRCKNLTVNIMGC